MLITRIRAKNFKTYKDLDLNLEVNESKPIILIGGMNGGGKTTLFQAIYHALYGLEIKDKNHFRELLNASVPLENNTQIELDIDFKGEVLMSVYSYRITRRYTLNPSNKPVESVTLNFNGEIFRYGTATPIEERKKSEDEVNKIIKANLPKELSKYFLFDAMESGKLLEEDSLARVIKENIESVMGFNKYNELGEAATSVKEFYVKEALEEKEEKEEYEYLLKKKKEIEEKKKKIEEERRLLLEYSIDKKELYNKAIQGKNLQEEYKERINLLKSKIENLEVKEKQFLAQTSKMVDSIETQIFLPNLVDSIKDELELIVSSTENVEKKDVLSEDQVLFVIENLVDFLQDNSTLEEPDENLVDEAKRYIIRKQKQDDTATPFDYFSDEELDVIKSLLKTSSINTFFSLDQDKKSIEKEYNQLPKYRQELEEMKKHLSTTESSLIEEYEKKEELLNQTKPAIAAFAEEIRKIDLRLNRFDISASSTINPKLEEIKKIEPLFKKISAALLKEKKKSIEETLCEDLNLTLTAYYGYVDRVELSDKKDSLIFKMYHKKGNEIHLNQLNAASKQVVVQVLLKSLHEFGDYNPPVMIDTVMGYLDLDTRGLLLKHYFPQLSHQTILFSTDSEITVDKDLPKIEKYVSRKYTLVRNVETQQTSINEKYFNH